MILLIDNYDSFTYNLYHLIGAFSPTIKVVRNDAIELKDIHHLSPSLIVLSPGPKGPKDAGICLEVIKEFAGKIPLFGVCLGHQCIGEAFGANIISAKTIMHGKTSRITLVEPSALFETLPSSFEVARYHSLSIAQKDFPSCLKITAQTQDGEIMAIEHRELPIFGVQFHPESIMGFGGEVMVKNLLKGIKNARNY